MAIQARVDDGVDRLKKSIVAGKFLGRRTTMAMRFDVPRCTLCGELASGTLEQVPGIALLIFDENDTAEYAGETKMAWDDQVTCRDSDGRVTLECPSGHQWQARPIDV
jgi:hypothetical protein